MTNYDFILQLNSMKPSEMADLYAELKAAGDYEKCHQVLVAAHANCGISTFIIDYLEEMQIVTRNSLV